MKTVAIVGSHPDTRERAPWGDLNVDIWVFNEAPTSVRSKTDPVLWCKRYDAVFQMHAPGIYRSPVNRADPKHWDWLQQSHACTIYTQDHDPDILDGSTYPLVAIVDELLPGLSVNGLQTRGYFTSSISYALALAVYQNYDKIMLYGVEMNSETEYAYQRDCIAFWVGMALGHGIAVELYCAQAIFDRPLYGYDGIIEQSIDTYLARAEALTEQLYTAHANVEYSASALAECYRKESAPGDAISAALNSQIELGRLDGQMEVNERYLAKLRSMRDAGAALYIDRNEFESAGAAMREDIARWGSEMHRSAGRLDYVLMAWQQHKTQMALDQLKQFAKAHLDAGYNFGKAQGVYEENHQHCLQMDDKIRAAGGAKALAMLTNQEAP